MKTSEAMTVLAKHRGDAVVVCALGMAANEWWAVTQSEDSFYMHGGMGFAASFALGLALSLPETSGLGAQQRRLALDESRLPAHRGRAAAAEPEAFRGRQPDAIRPSRPCRWSTRTAPTIRPSRAAPAFARRDQIDNLVELERKLPEIVAAPGPYFIQLRVEAEPEYQRAPPATYEGPEMKYRFGRALEKKLGIKVFGPRGF